jgi:hypothetical protein
MGALSKGEPAQCEGSDAGARGATSYDALRTLSFCAAARASRTRAVCITAFEVAELDTDLKLEDAATARPDDFANEVNRAVEALDREGERATDGGWAAGNS